MEEPLSFSQEFFERNLSPSPQIGSPDPDCGIDFDSNLASKPHVDCRASMGKQRRSHPSENASFGIDCRYSSVNSTALMSTTLKMQIDTPEPAPIRHHPIPRVSFRALVRMHACKYISGSLSV